MQVTLATRQLQQVDPLVANLQLRTQGILGAVTMTAYFVPPEGESISPDARVRWLEDTQALLRRSAHNLLDITDYAAAYFRQHPNDRMGLISVAAFAEWRATKRIIRKLDDGTKESRGYDQHTIQAFNDAMRLLSMLRIHTAVTYRPAKGRQERTVEDKGVLYHTSPLKITKRDRDTGETSVATGWRIYPGAIALLFSRTGQFMSLPKSVLQLDGRYYGPAKLLARYMYARHRITGAASGTIPWADALRIGGAAKTARKDPTRTRTRIMAGLERLREEGALRAVAATHRGIDYTIAAPARQDRMPRPSARRGIRRIRRVVRVPRVR